MPRLGDGDLSVQALSTMSCMMIGDRWYHTQQAGNGRQSKRVRVKLPKQQTRLGVVRVPHDPTDHSHRVARTETACSYVFTYDKYTSKEACNVALVVHDSVHVLYPCFILVLCQK